MRISVKTKPKAKRNKIEKIDPPSSKLRRAGATHFAISVTAPAEGGKANRALIKLLADYFRLPQSHVRIVSGMTSRNKIIEVV